MNVDDGQGREILQNASGDSVSDNLAQAPQQAQTSMNSYETKEKNIDMWRLKSVLWKILCEKETNRMMEELKAGGADAAMTEANHATSMGSYVMEFSEVYAELPSKLPEDMVGDVTVHVAFAGLLEVVSEKGLKITPVSGYVDDFTIANGDQE